MCGIAGLLRFDGESVDPTLLERMTDIIAHRGPDGEGHWHSGPVALGHRRLSIIDLSTHADQPMVSEDRQTVIIFNGEIYNYQELTNELEAAGVRFRTHSDTEVILHLYRLHGHGCVSRLRGMFAFAIWDEGKQELFLARDRIGIKPLYFFRSEKAFIFASEIKSVAASGYSNLRVNRVALSGYMRFLVVPQPDTVFDDIRKLEPGRTLIVRADGIVRENVYWRAASEGMGTATEAESSVISMLEAKLRESVGYHMVADVPVSAFLSGGLDSSSVVALMRQQAPQQDIDTFSISFPGQAEYDEDKYARKVAKHTSVGYHADSINESFLDDFDSIMWHLDEPFAVSSAYATYYLARNAAKHTKVVLTGDGGDELFAGYDGYLNYAYLGTGFSGLSTLVFRTLLAAARVTNSKNRALLRLVQAFGRRSGSEGLRYSEQVSQNSMYACSMAFSSEVFLDSLVEWPNNLMARYYDNLASDVRLDKMLFAEFTTRLVDEMLMKVDRMTMAHSLEARVPLLDHEVVEYAHRIPHGLKLRQNTSDLELKYVLKKAMEPYLPHDIIYRKKQGFDIPVQNWLSGNFLNLVTDRVLGGHLRDGGIISPDGVRRLVRLHEQGERNFSGMLMVLLSLETWAESYESRIGRVSFG